MKPRSIILLAAALFGTPALALADDVIFINNYNNVYASITSTGVTFSGSASGYGVPASEVGCTACGVVVNATGAFASISTDGDSVQFAPGVVGHNITFSSISAASPLEVFSFTDTNGPTTTYNYYATSAVETANGSAGAQAWFIGYLTVNGVQTGTDYAFTTTSDGASAFTSRTLVAAAAPEPSSLFLMGSGMLSVAGLALRRRPV